MVICPGTLGFSECRAGPGKCDHLSSSSRRPLAPAPKAPEQERVEDHASERGSSVLLVQALDRPLPPHSMNIHLLSFFWQCSGYRTESREQDRPEPWPAGYS